MQLSRVQRRCEADRQVMTERKVSRKVKEEGGEGRHVKKKGRRHLPSSQLTRFSGKDDNAIIRFGCKVDTLQASSWIKR